MVSSADKNSNPDNSPTLFTNFVNPRITKIKEIGLCSISIPLDLPYDNLPEEDYILFINCNLVEAQRIANQTASILNTITLPKTPIDRINVVYEEDFLPIYSLQNDIVSIQCSLTNIKGELHPLIKKNNTTLLEILYR